MQHNSLQKRALFSIFALGFSSGLPFLLLLSTLSVWLTESGVSKTQIGLFGLATIPYALKFLWAPLFDKYKSPFFSKTFGQRRSWLLLVQITLAVSLFTLGQARPEQHIGWTALLALWVGFCSASQDILVEAYRIERLPPKTTGFGASSIVMGYRVGMLLAGAGALYLAHHFDSWTLAYGVMAAFVGVGMLATCLGGEPVQTFIQPQKTGSVAEPYVIKKAFQSFFLEKPWWMIIPFIFFYKIGDTALQAMSMPFLLEIGFSKAEIASVAKTFGISAMMIGVLIGGWLLYQYSLFKNIYLCALLQFLAGSLFVLQSTIGYQISLLFITIGIENLACGMSQVALIAYLSSLCKGAHVSTHFAIFSSIASFSRIGLTVLAGYLADRVLWTDFYILVSLGCLPCLIWLWMCAPHFKKSQMAYS